MIRIILLLVLPLFFACEDPIEEVINLNDIIEESDNYKEGEVAEELSVELDSSLQLVIPFNKDGFEFIGAKQIDKILFPDRFGPIANNKIELISSSDTINYLHWSYSDSSKTMNAFYNWIDNFGEKGKSFFVGENTNFQKRPFILFVGDTSITFIESNLNLGFSEWENFQSIDDRTKDWNYVLEQRRRSKARWYVYRGNIKEELEY